MAVYLSPGVFPREIDLSVLPSAVGPLRPAFVGAAKKGPINTPVFITSSQQALDTFGEPFAQSYLMYAVLAYLEEGNQCYIVRVGVEYEAGGDADLNAVAIATDGSKTYGWGRVPLFKGIDFGRINLRSVADDETIVITAADKTSPTSYVGTGDATMHVVGTYTGIVDDTFTVSITSTTLTSGSLIDGATYEISRSSDGLIVSSGVLDEFVGTDGGVASQFISLGNGLSVHIHALTGALTTNDSFVFEATADNRRFAVSVDFGSASTYTLAPGTYSRSAFITLVNAQLGAEDYSLISVDTVIEGVTHHVLQFKTNDVGSSIQIVTANSEAFARTVGTTLYAFDIPKAHILGTTPGPYNITSANNRGRIDVVGPASTNTIDFNLQVGNAQAVSTISSTIDQNGGGVLDSFVITAPGGTQHVVVIATNPDDILIMRANYTYVKTLRLAQTLGVNYPYKGVYRGFQDPRPILPRSSTNDSSTPYSCDPLVSQSQCDTDSDYYANLVGFFVSTSAGTWTNDYSITVEVYTDAMGNSGNRFTVSVNDSLGVSVERFSDVSFDKTADRYIANFLNPGTKYGGTTGAKYINWEERPAYLNNDPLDALNYEVRNPSTVNGVPFIGGQNGIPLDPAYSAALDSAIIGLQSNNSGLYAFQNKDVYDINLLLTPGFSTGAVIGTATQLCESRGDVLYLVDPPFGLRPQQVVDWHNGMLLSDLSSAINSSYAALFWGWIKYYDQFNTNEIWIPPSGHVAAVFSRTARVTEQWYAAAGINRGRLLTAIDIEYTPSQGEEDLLYGSGNAVNPIVKFPADGIVIWGNRTLQRNETALSRINVRMLLIYLKKTLTRTLRSFIFEPNDKALWSQVNSVVSPFLGDIQSRRGITSFKVICDSSNNTPERIDRGELWVSVFIKPTRSVEYVVLNLAVVSTGANFSSEAVLAAGGIVSSVASV